MAHASARPSKVEVPRPTSSISTRLCGVALCRIEALSVISTMKVERPPARSSAAPMRVKIWSIGPRRSEEHTSELQSPDHLVCRLLLEKKKNHERTAYSP